MSEQLRKLASIHYGKSPNGVRVDTSDFPVFGTGGKVGYASEPLFSDPLVVVARKGTLGNPTYYNGECWIIDTAYAVVAEPGVDTKWLYYHFLNFNLESLNEATGVPSISRDYLYRIRFHTPPLSEQHKIAKILTTVDNLIEKTEALIAKYQAIKQGMMHDLFARGVDEHGHLRPPYDEAPELYKESELGWIPKEWEVEDIGEVAGVIDPQPDHRTPPEVEDGLPYIGMGEVRADGSIDFFGARKVSRAVLEKQCRSFDIYPEAFIFGKIGTIGNPTRVPPQRFYALSANIILITTVDSSWSDYLRFVIQSPMTERQILGETNTTCFSKEGRERNDFKVLKSD